MNLLILYNIIMFQYDWPVAPWCEQRSSRFFRRKLKSLAQGPLPVSPEAAALVNVSGLSAMNFGVFSFLSRITFVPTWLRIAGSEVLCWRTTAPTCCIPVQFQKLRGPRSTSSVAVWCGLKTLSFTRSEINQQLTSTQRFFIPIATSIHINTYGINSNISLPTELNHPVVDPGAAGLTAVLTTYPLDLARARMVRSRACWSMLIVDIFVNLINNY